MRTLTADTKLRTDKSGGEAPILVIEVVLPGGSAHYSDRDLTQANIRLDGRISSAGELRTQVKIDTSSRIVGSVGTMSVQLLDTDLVLKTFMDSHDLQGTKVNVYHWFLGQGASDMLLLLKGRIEESPVWSEDGRSLDIVIETPRRLKPVPFAPTEADGLAVDQDHLGKTWPMVFGTPSDVPACLVKDPPRGTLIRDMTQDGQVGETTAFGSTFSQDVPGNVFQIENVDEDFPQDRSVLVKVADEYMIGSFHGNTLTVTRRQVNKYTGVAVSGTTAQITLPPGVRAAGSYIIIRATNTTARNQSVTVTGIEGETVNLEVEGRTALALSPWLGEVDPLTADYIDYVYKQVGRVAYTMHGNPNVPIENQVADINRYPYTPAQGATWIHKAGSPVVVQSVKPVYVVNQLESERVIRVRAWRQVTKDDHSGFSQQQIVNVPSSLYTVNLSDSRYNGATTVTLEETLSDREAGWSDEIYVTLESSVGSNTSDALKYLIDHQSEGTLTAGASFAAVRPYLAAYPSNFALLNQEDVLNHVGDIAWQARCGVTWNGVTANLVYLSREPSAQAVVMNDATVAEGALKLTTTRIEDVITVFNVEWQPNYSDRKPKRIMIQTNVARYGKREETFKFTIYQNRSLVNKSAQFWARRRGRIWRIVDGGFWGLEAIGTDPLDYALWTISGFFSAVRGLVIEAGMKAWDQTSLSAILPIEAGTTVQSTYFWMSDSGDTAPALPDYTLGAGDLEYIQTPPPEEVNTALKPPELRDDQPSDAQEIWQAIAVQNEIRVPTALDWKTVLVCIIDPRETSERAALAQTNERIAEIDFLDPSHVNTTLNLERTDLLIARANSEVIIDRFVALRADNPVTGVPNSAIQADNPSVSYMIEGDRGTLIYNGGRYIVTPDNASGPFVGKVTKRPASPAEGTLWADTGFSTQTPIGTGAREIKVLGDGSGMREGDAILVFRDSHGDYFTPGGGASVQVLAAKVLSDAAQAEAVPIGLWYTTDFTTDPDITTTGAAPMLVSPYKIPAGTWCTATKLPDGNWFIQVPVVVPYVA